MKKRRRSMIVAGCLLAAAAAMPSAAAANPLLSGYGGPGQGNQAILGSQLLGGPGGGSGGGSGSPGAVSRQDAGASATLAVSASTPGGAFPGSATGRHSPAAVQHRHSAARRPPQTGSEPAESTVAANLAYDRAERGSSASASGGLGLSAADFLYAALILAALLFTGVLTRRLGRPTTAKGHG